MTICGGVWRITIGILQEAFEENMTSGSISKGTSFAPRHFALFKVNAPMGETACAENNFDFYHQNLFPLPEADKPDF
jgi:hypothetical protein